MKIIKVVIGIILFILVSSFAMCEDNSDKAAVLRVVNRYWDGVTGPLVGTKEELAKNIKDFASVFDFEDLKSSGAVIIPEQMSASYRQLKTQEQKDAFATIFIINFMKSFQKKYLALTDKISRNDFVATDVRFINDGKEAVVESKNDKIKIAYSFQLHKKGNSWLIYSWSPKAPDPATEESVSSSRPAEENINAFAKGLFYGDSRDYSKSIKEFNAVIEKNPNDSMAYCNRGIAYLNIGHFDTALPDLTKAIAIDPKNGRAYGARGMVYQYDGKVDEAIADYDKAIELDPQDIIAYTRRGIAYQTKKYLDKALSDYNKAIEINSRFYAEPYFLRGYVFLQKSLFDSALSDFNKAIEINSKYADAYYWRGVAYYDKGNNDQAISDFNKALEINPNYAQAYNNRGMVYFKKGDIDKSLSDFDKAIEVNSIYAPAYYDRGNVYLKNGKIDKAIKDFSMAIFFDPKYADAYFWRANAYLQKKEYDKAWTDVLITEALRYKVDQKFKDDLTKTSGGGPETHIKTVTAKDLGLEKRIFLTLNSDKTNAFVDGEVSLIVKMYVNKLNVTNINIPTLYQNDLSKVKFGEPKQVKETSDGLNYDVLEFRASLSGAKSGHYEIGPALDNCYVFTPSPAGGYAVNRLELKSQDIEITISKK